jgi:hypothetical protein
LTSATTTTARTWTWEYIENRSSWCDVSFDHPSGLCGLWARRSSRNRGGEEHSSVSSVYTESRVECSRVEHLALFISYH